MTIDVRLALEVAVHVADEAAHLLRDAFHRGADLGPVADEADRHLRGRLSSAFPGLPVRFDDPAAGGGDAWLIQPHDGAAAAAAGARGASLAIGLRLDGEPVLGVVQAYAALGPDNHFGDTIAWAKGQPLTRSGRTVVRPPFADALAPGRCLLVPEVPGPHVSPMDSMVHPARLLAWPSLNYCLALVAVGEADAAIGDAPARPTVAAQALLRAVGAGLLDEDGQAIVPGRAVRGRVVAGGAGMVGVILARLAYTPPMADEHDSADGTCRPSRRRLEADAGRLSRALGCWMGQLAGDSLGSLVEFRPARAIARAYGDGPRLLADGGTYGTIAGQATDDSEMAMALARTILDHGGFDPTAVLGAYADWLASSPFDSGLTVRQALNTVVVARQGGADLLAAAEQARSQTSQGNGGLMRLAPLAIWGQHLPVEDLDGLMRADTRLTHPHRVCLDASAAYGVALAGILYEGLEASEAYALAVGWDRARGISASVTHALEDARAPDPPILDQRNIGHVILALQNAFHQLLHAKSFEEGIVGTVRLGGDTDTNAAVAGALLGALYGWSAVPLQWRQMVLSCRPARTLGDVEHPRPVRFWPTDALCLAEALVASGPRQEPMDEEFDLPALVDAL